MKLTVRFPLLFRAGNRQCLQCRAYCQIYEFSATVLSDHARKARGSLHLRCQRAPINDCGNAPSCQHPLGSHRPTTCQVDGNLEAYTIQRFPAVPLVWAVLTSASFCCTGVAPRTPLLVVQHGVLSFYGPTYSSSHVMSVLLGYVALFISVWLGISSFSTLDLSLSSLTTKNYLRSWKAFFC